MTPEEFSLKERDVIAREKQADQDERKNDIAEEASKRNRNAMIATAFIGLFGALYIKYDKDKDVSLIERRIIALTKVIKDNDCNKEVSEWRRSYEGGMCSKMLDYHRKSWAELHRQGKISESK